MPSRRRRLLRPGLAVAVRPSLRGVALRQAGRLARPRWWLRPPFLPVPDREHLAFRLETQYGDAGARTSGADLVAFLRWCRVLDRLDAQRGAGQGPQ